MSRDADKESMPDSGQDEFEETTSVMSDDELAKITKKMLAQSEAEGTEDDPEPPGQPTDVDDAEVGLHDRITLQPGDQERDTNSADQVEDDTIDVVGDALDRIVEKPSLVVEKEAISDEIIENRLRQDSPVDVEPKLDILPRRFKMILWIGIVFGILVVAVIIAAIIVPSDPAPKILIVASETQPSQVPIKEKAKDKDTTEESADVVDDLGTIQENFQLARKFYLAGDGGRSEDGKKLDQAQRIYNLVSALPHLGNLIKLYQREKTNAPDVWFMKARTEYSLAKLGHDRAQNAKLAIESYKMFKRLVSSPTKNQKKTMARNMKALRAWSD